MLNNYQSITGLVNDFINSLTYVVSDSAFFKSEVVRTLKNAVPVILKFAVTQLGLAKLPDEVKSAVQFVPNKIYDLLRKAVSKIRLPGTPVGDLYKDALTSIIAIGTEYQLWEARDDHGNAHVKVAKKNATGQFVLFAELKVSSFTNTAQAPQATQNITNLIAAAKAYATELDRQKKTPTANGTALLKSLQAQVTNLQNLVKADIEHDACAALGVGCFAAGTRLWTPEGFRNIEQIQPNELVFARSEWDPSGPIEAKVVEEVFERFSEVLHLHVAGQVIRTTGEHPFYARAAATRSLRSGALADKGEWTKVDDLQPGDQILTEAGEWKEVEEVWHTGEWETVYNLRVADHHTYFVGEEPWGWCAWAHNQYRVTHRYALGSVVLFTFDNYSAKWYVPKAFLTPAGNPNQVVKDAVEQDRANGWGNTLQGLVNQYASAWGQLNWNDKAVGGRRTAIENAIASANSAYQQLGPGRRYR